MYYSQSHSVNCASCSQPLGQNRVIRIPDIPGTPKSEVNYHGNFLPSGLVPLHQGVLAPNIPIWKPQLVRFERMENFIFEQKLVDSTSESRCGIWSLPVPGGLLWFRPGLIPVVQKVASYLSRRLENPDVPFPESPAKCLFRWTFQ